MFDRIREGGGISAPTSVNTIKQGGLAPGIAELLTVSSFVMLSDIFHAFVEHASSETGVD